jgi:SOS-response transcriptional repressor LexA
MPESLEAEDVMTTAELCDVLIETVKAYIIKFGYPPSVRDLAAELGISTTRTHALLVGLREEGRVQWISGRYRTLRVIGDDDR